ncbi:MAG: VOC family protein [Actinomycetota bacterium]
MAAPTPNPDRDTKPDIWVGHVAIPADDLQVSYDFYLGLGLREVVVNERIGVLELAGGSHLVLAPRSSSGGFDLAPSVDLMVDDVDAARAAWLAHNPSEIVKGGVHRTFRFTDPAGNAIAVHDSHVTGVV